MKRKCISLVLILVILLTSTGLVYAGWGFKTDKFGPIVVIAGHPWGDCNKSTAYPNTLRPGTGGGFSDPSTSAVTNYTLQFYYNYVVKKTMHNPSFTQKQKKGD